MQGHGTQKGCFGKTNHKAWNRTFGPCQKKEKLDIVICYAKLSRYNIYNRRRIILAETIVPFVRT